MTSENRAEEIQRVLQPTEEKHPGTVTLRERVPKPDSWSRPVQSMCKTTNEKGNNRLLFVLGYCGYLCSEEGCGAYADPAVEGIQVGNVIVVVVSKHGTEPQD